MQASLGKRTRKIVELVDIYRTLCELVGIPLPANDSHPVEGDSLVPLLRDPTGSSWPKTTGPYMYYCMQHAWMASLVDLIERC
eukprot:SAG22_NODE_464_length_10191_cov_14.495541_6_plen_83_part_00